MPESLIPFIDDAGATVVLILFVVFACQVVKMQYARSSERNELRHQRSMARDSLFMAELSATRKALQACMEGRLVAAERQNRAE